MIFIGFSNNLVLNEHLNKISKHFKTAPIGNVRTSTIMYLTDLLKARAFYKKKLFIYNTSPTNLLTTILSKLFFSKVIFHLHDPKPHSGAFNPIIYLTQMIQLIFSDYVVVFDNKLVNDTLSYYPLIPKKTIKVFNHGLPTFKIIPTTINPSKVNFGFFGRNMPYKGLNEFIKLAKNTPKSLFYVCGSGYESEAENNNLDNLIFINRYIENNEYYSILRQMDYVVVPYKNISYSGVIIDCISLGKEILVSQEVSNAFNYPNMTLISELNSPSKQPLKNSKSLGWNSYAKSLKTLI